MTAVDGWERGVSNLTDVIECVSRPARLTVVSWRGGDGEKAAGIADRTGGGSFPGVIALAGSAPRSMPLDDPPVAEVGTVLALIEEAGDRP